MLTLTFSKVEFENVLIKPTFTSKPLKYFERSLWAARPRIENTPICYSVLIFNFGVCVFGSRRDALLEFSNFNDRKSRAALREIFRFECRAVDVLSSIVEW